MLLLLGVLHVAVALLGAMALSGRTAWLLAMEAGLVLTLVISLRLLDATFAPLSLLRTSADLLREGDYTTRLARTGMPELDALADVYNEMADRLRADRARLVEQELLLQRLIDASPAGVVALDFDGRVSLVSPSAERLLGWKSTGVAGRALADIAGPEASELREIAPGGSRMLSRHGRRLRARRAELQDRGFPRTFFLVEEMTDELAASERAAFERIVQVMAHEVRNSVGVVRSLLESAAAMGRAVEPGPPADFDEAMSVAARRLLGLNAFMNAVADVVRLPPPARADCDVARLVRDIVTLFTPEAQARGVALESRCDLEVVASLDKNQVEQALLNVLRNAVEASPAGGVVRLTLEEDAATRGGWCLRIRDQGPGISPDVAARLFTPFFTTRPGGRGIGLMLAREVFLRHGFPFSLSSHPGGGAEFVVRWAGGAGSAPLR